MSDPVQASFNAIVRGRVQGVFFRDFVKTHADTLGLTGYVRNLPAGTVEVQVEGDRQKLEELLRSLYQGPPSAKVDNVEVHWSDYRGDSSGFSVRF